MSFGLSSSVLSHPFRGKMRNGWGTFIVQRARLFWQEQLALDVQRLVEDLGAGVRLASADEDLVLAFGNDGFAGFRNHAQITRVQFKMQCL